MPSPGTNNSGTPAAGPGGDQPSGARSGAGLVEQKLAAMRELPKIAGPVENLYDSMKVMVTTLEGKFREWTRDSEDRRGWEETQGRTSSAGHGPNDNEQRGLDELTSNRDIILGLIRTAREVEAVFKPTTGTQDVVKLKQQGGPLAMLERALNKTEVNARLLCDALWNDKQSRGLGNQVKAISTAAKALCEAVKKYQTALTDLVTEP